MAEVRVEMTANVGEARAAVGPTVAEGEEPVILEWMTMETLVTAPTSGAIRELRVGRPTGW